MVMRHCCRAHYHSHDETIVGSFLAASYVDRILRGETPGDLPVQAQTRLAMVINLMTANALGLEVPRPCSSAPTR
jgi:ABC-type uncharacterized transport system substrate-binding protein